MKKNLTNEETWFLLTALEDPKTKIVKEFVDNPLLATVYSIKQGDKVLYEYVIDPKIVWTPNYTIIKNGEIIGRASAIDLGRDKSNIVKVIKEIDAKIKASEFLSQDHGVSFSETPNPGYSYLQLKDMDSTLERDIPRKPSEQRIQMQHLHSSESKPLEFTAREWKPGARFEQDRGILLRNPQNPRISTTHAKPEKNHDVLSPDDIPLDEETKAELLNILNQNGINIVSEEYGKTRVLDKDNKELFVCETKHEFDKETRVATHSAKISMNGKIIAFGYRKISYVINQDPERPQLSSRFADTQGYLGIINVIRSVEEKKKEIEKRQAEERKFKKSVFLDTLNEPGIEIEAHNILNDFFTGTQYVIKRGNTVLFTLEKTRNRTDTEIQLMMPLTDMYKIFVDGFTVAEFSKRVGNTRGLIPEEKDIKEAFDAVESKLNEIEKKYDDTRTSVEQQSESQRNSQENIKKPLDPVIKDLMIRLIKSDAIKIKANIEWNESSNEGDYEIQDINGKTLFRFTCNPYTLRLALNDTIVAECYPEPIRSNTAAEDDVKIPDKNLDDLLTAMFDKYNKQEAEKWRIHKPEQILRADSTWFANSGFNIKRY